MIIERLREKNEDESLKLWRNYRSNTQPHHLHVSVCFEEREKNEVSLYNNSRYSYSVGCK